jgi:hypothetical protein
MLRQTVVDCDELLKARDKRIAELEAVLERLVNIVDVNDGGPELEPFFVEPVKQARAALAKAR